MIHAVYETNAGDWVRGARYAQHTIEYMSKHGAPLSVAAHDGLRRRHRRRHGVPDDDHRRRPSAGRHHRARVDPHVVPDAASAATRSATRGRTRASPRSGPRSAAATSPNATNGPEAIGALGTGNAIGRGRDVECMRHADTYGTDSFGFASYSKPAAVLHQLRALAR